jgi:Mg-chelatase subunit ChlI
VLVIESGEIELPTPVKGMKSIGLPKNVIYACLAETIVLALEGRFEVFTIGRDTEWEKVKEIYKLGIKHGMKLAAISGVKGVYSDEDIAKVVALAKKARSSWKGTGDAKSAPRKPAPKKAATKRIVAEKPLTEKAAVKKPAAKKSAPRKAPGKAAAAPKKPAAAKAPAKKAAARSATRKKPGI